MYSRWKKIKEDLNISKKDIKKFYTIPNELLRVIEIEDEENTIVIVTYDKGNKKYSLSIIYKNGKEYTSSIQSINEDFILKEL